MDKRLLQLIRPGRRGLVSVYRVFPEAQETFPPPPPIPLPAARARGVAVRDAIPRRDAEAVHDRKPGEPLIPRAHAHRQGGWGRPQVGTADQYDIGTAEQRVSAISEEEKRRIAAQYGVQFQKKESP